ncbi:MAG: hypothetical protein R3B57_12205 [Phycisphaerales bacterium]
MTETPPTRVIPGIVALSAFSVACVAGLGAELGASAVLTRALISMAGGYVLGLALAWAAGRAVADHAARCRAERPVPEVALPPEVAARDAQEPRSPHNPNPKPDEEAQARAAA